MTVPDFKHISLDSYYFLIILHILYSIYDRSKAEMAKFEDVYKRQICVTVLKEEWK